MSAPDALDRLGESISKAVEECPAGDVLSILSTSLVGLTLALLELRGEDPNKEIRLEGGERTVVITAAKEAKDGVAG